MSTKELIASTVKDIRFWIILFFIIRMYGITNPPLEVGHNWRQTDGLMIARNFYEHDANIFYPTIDVAADLTGIVGSEFPILNYIIYLVSLVFGFEHWHGRLVVLIIASLGTLYFYKIIKRYFDEASAFNATILLLVSYWFACSRKIIPDPFAASLCFIGIYYGLRYLYEGKVLHVLTFFVMALIACLSKIAVATLLTVMIFPVLNPTIPIGRKVVISVFSAVVLAGVCWWYFLWVPYLNATYEFPGHFFMGMSFSQGIEHIQRDLPLFLKRLYSTPFKYTGFAIFLGALFLIIKHKKWLTLSIFFVPFVSFLVLLVKTGSSIVGDTYYLVTLIPSMAFVTGHGLTYLKNKKIVAAILIVIGVESLAAQIYDFRIRQPYASLASLEGIMDSISQRDDRIMVNAGQHNPLLMYFAHRRGWSVTTQDLHDQKSMEYAKDHGCKYIVLAIRLYGDTELDYPLVYQSEYFKIFKVE